MFKEKDSVCSWCVAYFLALCHVAQLHGHWFYPCFFCQGVSGPFFIAVMFCLFEDELQGFQNIQLMVFLHFSEVIVVIADVVEASVELILD